MASVNPNRRQGNAHIGPVQLAGQLTAPEVPPRKFPKAYLAFTREDKIPVKLLRFYTTMLGLEGNPFLS